MVTLVTEVSCGDETIRDDWTPKRVQSRVNGLDNGSDISEGREQSAVGMLMNKQLASELSGSRRGRKEPRGTLSQRAEQQYQELKR